MVFGNINPESCVGKLFTRNPDTGVNEIYGYRLLTLFIFNFPQANIRVVCKGMKF
jgi:hypothetical protein